MRYIKVPDAIQLYDLAHKRPIIENDGSEMEPWTFQRYLATLVLPDPAMGKGYKADKAVRAVDKAFEGAKPGDVVGVEDDHWERMKTAVEDPQGGRPNLGITSQLVPFAEAIVEAKETKPDN